MTHVLGFSVFGVDWQFLKPFIVIGLAFLWLPASLADKISAKDE